MFQRLIAKQNECSRRLIDYYYLYNENLQTLFTKQIVSRFLKGEVGILPTDTVYGIMCSSNHPTAIERIYEIKARERSKKFQRLIFSLDSLSQYNIEISPQIKRLADKFWPGPLTLVVTNTEGKSFGFRIPDSPFLLSILRAIKSSLVATSANISGSDPQKSHALLFKDLPNPPDFVVLEKSGAKSHSTVVQIKDNSFEVLREGAVSRAEIEAALE